LFALIGSRSNRSAERLDTIYIPPLYTPIIGPAFVARHQPPKLRLIELSFRRTRYIPMASTENQVQPVVEFAKLGVIADQLLVGSRRMAAPTLRIRR
jgi:hypothetical protein